MGKENGMYKEIGAGFYTIKSFERLGLEYTVNLNNPPSCTCPFFQEKKQLCKHIQLIVRDKKMKVDMGGQMDFSMLLAMSTIDQAKKSLIDWNRANPITVEQLKEILVAEQKGKNRKGITTWVEHSINIGQLAGEFFIDYQGKVSILKSTVQKYIRRSEVDKAVRAAKTLFKISKGQAIARMKIIIVEDVDSCLEAVEYIDSETDLNTFLGVVKFIASAPKSKKCAKILDGVDKKTAETMPITSKEIEFIKSNLMDESKTKDIAPLICRMCNLGMMKEVYEIMTDCKVVRTCLERANAGTFWEGDKWILIIAAIRYVQGAYSEKNMSLPVVDGEAIEGMKFSEIDWYCLDFHTPIGRLAVRAFMSKHRGMDEDHFKGVWFHAESGMLMGNVQCHYNDGVEANKEWIYYKQEVMELIEWSKQKHFFNSLDLIKEEQGEVQPKNPSKETMLQEQIEMF